MGETERTRKCSKCKAVLPVSAFQRNKSKSSGLQTFCRTCATKVAREWQIRNPERHAANVRRNALGTKYAMAEADYYRLYATQHGCCAICARHFKAAYVPSSFGRGKGAVGMLCVEHSHKSGKVRGLVCHDCNTLLGFMEKQREYIGAAWRYLIEHDRQESETCATG